MPIVSTDIPEQMNEELKLLVAAGLYKSKSEALRDAIRTLAYKYHDKIEDVKQMRVKMDQQKHKKNLSDVVEEMRDEEMH